MVPFDANKKVTLQQRYRKPVYEEAEAAWFSDSDSLNAQNYRSKMHRMLFLEEAYRCSILAQMNVKSLVTLVHQYYITSEADGNAEGSGTLRIAPAGYLFGKLTLSGIRRMLNKSLCHNWAK